MKSKYLLIFPGLVILISLIFYLFYPPTGQQDGNESIVSEENVQSQEIKRTRTRSSGLPDNSSLSDIANLEVGEKTNREIFFQPSKTIKQNDSPLDSASFEFNENRELEKTDSGFESMDPETRIYFENTSYLTEDELNHYLQMEDAQLRSLAEGGDIGAQIRLGVRLIKNNINAEEGINWLIEAASHGSFEALRELRWVYQFGAGSIGKDDFAFLAWAKVAYMVGDWQALWHQGASSRVTSQELIVVDVLAAYYFNEINTRHELRTGENLQVRIRPGFEHALNQFLNNPAAN